MKFKYKDTSEFRFGIGTWMCSPATPGDAPLLSEAESWSNPVSTTASGVNSHAKDSGWTKILETIREWQRDPQQVEDEGIEAPTAEVLFFAQRFIERTIAEGQPAPSAVVPDGEGGVSFETYQKPIYQKMAISKDLAVEEFRFENSRLVYRRVLPILGTLDLSLAWDACEQSSAAVSETPYDDSTTFSSELLNEAA